MTIEMSSEEKMPAKRQGYIAVGAGALFFLVAAAGKQPAFFGVSVLGLAIGGFLSQKIKVNPLPNHMLNLAHVVRWTRQRRALSCRLT
jgi:hypothetical protein